MKSINYKNIKGLHLELTTKCNAICDMCNRNFKGKTRENLKLIELSLIDCKKIFKPSFINKLELLSICGVYGDPLMAKDLLTIIKYFYDHNPNLHINIYTNGSLQLKIWWTKLAKALKNGYVIFGIDGIGKVHSIHRKNTDFDLIINNAKIFINHGGKARWDFIVFKHNEHQVKDAEKLSKELGFEIFQIKKTSRFFKNLYEKDKNLDSTFAKYGKHPIFDTNGNIINYLEMPSNKEYRNNSEDKLLKLIKKHGCLNKYFDTVKINCSAINTNGIFISAFGDVYPCCNVYQQVCYHKLHNVDDPTEINEYNMAIKYNISAYKDSIENIVNGPFFKELQNSWNLLSLEKGKPKSCSRNCGINLDMHKNTHKKIDKRYI